MTSALREVIVVANCDRRGEEIRDRDGDLALEDAHPNRTCRNDYEATEHVAAVLNDNLGAFRRKFESAIAKPLDRSPRHRRYDGNAGQRWRFGAERLETNFLGG